MAERLVHTSDQFEWQRSVKDRAADPPVSPARGDRYLIVSAATGDWIGKENQITYCSNNIGPVWTFVLPLDGMVTWVQDEGATYLYDVNEWKVFGLEQFAVSGEYVGLSGAFGAHIESVSSHSPIVFTWLANGPYEVDSKVDGARVMPTSGTISSVILWRDVAGTSGSTVLDLNINGGTAYTTQGNRPSISFDDADHRVNCALPDLTALGQYDILTIDIDQIESGDPQNLTLIIYIIP